MTYDEFMSLIPEETARIVKRFVVYIDKNIMTVQFVNDTECRYRSNIVLQLMLYVLSKEEKYSSIMKDLGIEFYSESFLNASTNDFSQAKYTKYSEMFEIYKLVENYYALGPLQIIDRYVNSFKDSTIAPWLDIHGIKNVSRFKEKLKEYSEKERYAYSKKLYERYMRNNPRIEVISYLDTVGKIFAYLHSNTEMDTDKIKAVSYILGLFIYEDVNTDFNTKSVMLSYLEKVGFTKESVEEHIGIKISKEDLEKYIPARALNCYFGSVLPASDTTIDKILETALVKDTRNYMLSLFTECGIDDDEIKNAIKFVRDERNESTNTDSEDFYRNLMPQTIEFMNFAGKVYKYLKENIKDIKPSNPIVQDEEDLIPLSILISSYVYGTSIALYFTENGILITDIESMLGIKINVDEINKIELDEKLLIKTYNRFFNSRTSSIEDIVRLLSDGSITNSKIVQRIYEYKFSKSLSTNLTNLIKDYEKERAIREEKQKEDEFFHGLNPVIYKFFEKVLAYYSGFGQDFDDNNREVLAIILGARNTPEAKDIDEYTTSVGLTGDSIANFFNCRISKDSYNIPMDEINKKFRMFIYGGVNKDKPRELITIASIIENAMNKELNDSFEMDRFMNSIGLSYNIFINFADKVKAYHEEISKKETTKLIMYLNRCGEEVYTFMMDATKAYKYLKKNLSRLKLVYEENDIEELSILITALQRSNLYSRLFEHNAISLETVLAKTGLTQEDLREISSTEEDEDLLIPHFAKYITPFRKGYNLSSTPCTITEIIKAAFDDDINNSQVLETIIARIGRKYDNLKEEIYAGKEKEIPLTKEERLQVFSSEEAPEMNTSDITGLISYGESLRKHTDIISSEFTELALNDTTSSSIDTIKGLINQVFVEHKETKTSFLSRFFGLDEENTNSSYDINPDVLDDLRREIDRKIELLTKELTGYDYLRKYIEIYLKQVEGYYAESLKHYKEAKEKLEEYQREGTDYAKLLEYTTLVQVLNDSVNRFKTSEQLMKQELFKVHRAIVNHFITINALRTSREDIIPVIGSELMIGAGRNSMMSGLDISNSLIGLFNSVLDSNIEGTKEALAKLKESSISEETMNKMMQDIGQYINSTSMLETQIESITLPESDIILSVESTVKPDDDSGKHFK